MQPDICGWTTVGLSYGRFKAHQLETAPSTFIQGAVCDRQEGLDKVLSGKPGKRQTKDDSLTQTNLPPKTKINQEKEF
jgi:hypothetical protein